MANASSKNNVEDEITKIKKELEGVEKNDYEFRQWSEELKQLRHFVIYTHSVIENILISIIANKVINPVYIPATDTSEESKDSLTDYIVSTNAMTFVLDEMEFSNKLRAIEKLKIFTDKKGKKLLEKLKSINRIRNMFSHPTAYVNEINAYSNRAEYLSLLNLLRNTLDELMNYQINLNNSV